MARTHVKRTLRQGWARRERHADRLGAIEWLRFDEITRNGADISAVKERTGRGVNAVQSTAADQPAVAASASGRPTGDFAVANTEWMDVVGLTSTATSYTFVAFVDQRSITTILQYFMGNVPSGGSVDWGPQFITNVSSHVGILDGATHRDLGSAVAGEQVLAWVVDGVADTATLYRNGVLVGSAAFTSNTTVSASAVKLCSYQSPAAAQMLDGELGEAIVVPRALTLHELRRLTEQLRRHYGLAS